MHCQLVILQNLTSHRLTGGLLLFILFALFRSNTICSQFDFSIGKCWEATTMMPCFPFSLMRTVCSTLLMQQINYSYLETVSFLFSQLEFLNLELCKLSPVIVSVLL